MAVPVASFTFDTIGIQATLTDTSTNTPTSWSWNFGDTDSGVNNTSTLQNPVHIFTGYDNYEVTLISTNGDGSSTPVITFVNTTPPPVASFTVLTANLLATFTDTSIQGPTSWLWDFGDPDSGVNNTSTLQNPTHTFTGYDDYLVTLNATNFNGSSDPFEFDIITAPPPTAFFSYGTLGTEGTFTDTSTGSPTSWAWDFGDPASGLDNTSTLQNPVHTFTGFNTFNVTLVASNGNGSSGPVSHLVTTVSSVPPFRFTINFGLPTRAPGSGTVQIPYIGYYEDGSLINISLVQYSLDGLVFHNATAVNPSELVNLVFGPDGVNHTFNWNAAADVSTDLFNIPIYFRMQATSSLYISSMGNTTFTLFKVTKFGSAQDNSTFPDSYEGIPGRVLVGIFKGSK
jgi:PKD repeat protein